MPTLTEFRDVKARHPGMCLLFANPGFYAAINEDAELVNRLFGTQIEDYGDYTEATFPASQLLGYIARLTQNGHHCATVDTDGAVHRQRMPGERKPGEHVELGEARGVGRNIQE